MTPHLLTPITSIFSAYPVDFSINEFPHPLDVGYVKGEEIRRSSKNPKGAIEVTESNTLWIEI